MYRTDGAWVGLVVQLLVPDVWKDYVLRCVGPPEMSRPHLGQRHRYAFGVGIVKSEPHPKDDTALKTLLRVGNQPNRIGVPTGMEQERRDLFDRPTIQPLLSKKTRP